MEPCEVNVMTITEEKDPMMRMVLAARIQKFVDDPDMYWEETTEPTEELLTYLEETGAPIPELPDDPERRRDVIKIMVRYWASREALNLINRLYGENNIWGEEIDS
jgi:hypothetical protein